MYILIVFMAFVGYVIFVAVKARVSAGAALGPEALELNSVRDALMEKQGWSMERAEAARSEYVRFLKLVQMNPRFMLVPWANADGQDDLDQFWHQHILDTAKYGADCHRLFGRMIHHNPHVVLGSELEADAVAKTQRLYARTFGSGPYGRPADKSLVTSCAACGTGGGDSSGHSGSNHDGAHSDGGHSDGGHGCGGHSCGHGCGGH